jgi:hypothetical protein
MINLRGESNDLITLVKTLIKKNYTAGQMINELREVEVKLCQGIKASEVIKRIGASMKTYYRWRKESEPSGAVVLTSHSYKKHYCI